MKQVVGENNASEAAVNQSELSPWLTPPTYMSTAGGCGTYERLCSLSAQKLGAKLLPDSRLGTDADLSQIDICVVAATDMGRNSPSPLQLKCR